MGGGPEFASFGGKEGNHRLSLIIWFGVIFLFHSDDENTKLKGTIKCLH